MKTRLHLNSEGKFIVFRAGKVAVLLLMLAPLVLSGCLSKPALARQTYSLDSVAFSTNQPAVNATNGKVVAIRTLQICPLFDGRSFVYRTGADRFQSDPYAGFLIPSNRALEIPIRKYLRNSGAFKDVVEPGSRLAPETLVEVYVTELYGDFRQANSPAAVLSIRLLFFDAKNAMSSQPFLEKAYTRRVPLEHKNAPALVAGWNKALSQIMAEATSDFASTQKLEIGSSDSSGSPQSALMRNNR